MKDIQPILGNSSPAAGFPCLTELLAGIGYSVVHGESLQLSRQMVTTLQADSRSMEPGAVFFAVIGALTDGHRYIDDAIAGGCAAVIVEKDADVEIPLYWNGLVIEVEDSRKAYAHAAENFYGHPAADLTLIAITGTNGKTTISYLLEDILGKAGVRVGVIGTINYRYHTDMGMIEMASPFTTPEAMQLQALLRKMADAGVEYVIMEVSSHALAQSRIGNICFDIAAFTNLSHDHLDYHLTMEDYFQAKSILFTSHLKKGGKAIISTPLRPADNEDWSGRVAGICTAAGIDQIDCGPGEDAEVQLLDYTSTLNSTTLQLRVGKQLLRFSSPLVGHFNVDNLLTTLSITAALGLDIHQSIHHISDTAGAPGRLQRIGAGGDDDHLRPVIFADYAHTPDALRQVLATVSALPHRDLFCVFGCGGDRDTSKRPVMGSLAGGLADVVIVTDDNPRSEQPEDILSQIVPGVEKAGMNRKDITWLAGRNAGEKGYVVIGSRREAISRAIRGAGNDDIVLIAGKGHEKYQLTRAGKRFFDDCLEAESALLSWSLESIIKATGGSLKGNTAENRLFGEVSTDSRTIGPGDIFVALYGERFDGHNFLAKVTDKGAGCLVINRDWQGEIPVGIATVRVDDTLQALGHLAGFRRSLMASLRDQVVIAITGSCGKTTVKEMTSAILRRKWPAGPDFPEDCVLQTRGNLNNLIGLPLSLLPLDLHQRAAVLEMGMNAPGEIRSMARVANADVCCITNVHGVHLEGLHTIDGVAAAKEELFAEAADDAVLVINLDNPYLSGMAARYPQRKVTFGSISDPAVARPDFYASDVGVTASGELECILHHGGKEQQVRLSTIGMHNVTNALTAAAITSAAGASLEEICVGLGDFRPSDRRMVMEKTGKGLTVVNDTYNANPASMAAGLRAVKEMADGRYGAVLGDMLELGEAAADAHYELGQLVAELGLDFLAVVGEHREVLARGAIDNGMAVERAKVCDEKEMAASWIEQLQENEKLGTGDWLLVKASRGLQMETIVARLTGKP